MRHRLRTRRPTGIPSGPWGAITRRLLAPLPPELVTGRQGPHKTLLRETFAAPPFRSMSQTLPAHLLGRTIDALSLGPWQKAHLNGRSPDWESSDLLVTLGGGVQLALTPTRCEILPSQNRASASSPVAEDVLVCIGTTLIDVIRTLLNLPSWTPPRQKRYIPPSCQDAQVNCHGS